MENYSDKWVFIVNPVAGNGYGTFVIPQIESMAVKHGIEAVITLTAGPGNATELTFQAIRAGAKIIIAVGGDGTFNEVARALTGRKDITTGIIPAGTGNDFVQILGFPNRFSNEHWDIFFGMHARPMDAGSCNGMKFFNGMGLGFDAQVAAENYSEPGKVKRGSKYKYIWHIVKTLLFFNEKKMTTYNGEEKTETDCFINTVSIGRRFAGGFFLTPKAIADDGLLDICNVKKLSFIERLYILLKVPKGTHITDRRVNYYQARELYLEFPEPVPYHVDGELLFTDKFTITLLPEALNIIYNPEGNHFFSR